MVDAFRFMSFPKDHPLSMPEWLFSLVYNMMEIQDIRKVISYFNSKLRLFDCPTANQLFVPNILLTPMNQNEADELKKIED